jgi:hypothetical protein
VSSPLTHKQMDVLLTNLEDQGAVVRQTSKGYLLKFPNGETATFHRSPSDHRAILNMRSRVRHAGLSWPFDRVS